jgi:uncharacterized protein YjaZ
VTRTRAANALIAAMLSLPPGWRAIAAVPVPETPGGPTINIEDVARFYRVYDAANGRPTAEKLQHDYLDDGSPGLHRFARLRKITGARIAENLEKRPEMYREAVRCMTVLPRVRERLTEVFRQLARLYPEASFPPVTLAVGSGKPVAVADESGVMIGIESLCAVTWLESNLEDRSVHLAAHEYAHVQQAIAAPDFYNKNKPTVLEESLIEGAAEFTAEITSGSVSDTDLRSITQGREKSIETEFIADAENTNLTRWLYNGTLTKPGDLGYWVGYRIVKSYYVHADDKRRALREILGMKSVHEFVAESRWYPGIKLD